MSTSCSSSSSSFSSRLATTNRSSTLCLASSFSGRCAAMVSARRPGSSMPAMLVRISGGIFLLSLTYWSNCCVTARRRASTSGDGSPAGCTGTTSAVKCSAVSWMALVSARCTPSTSTFTVPSGSFSICRMLETQPISNMSSGLGSSLPAAFWATSMIWRPASIAASSALMDLGRPTNSGMTMCGNTTTSRSGSRGSVMGSGGRMGCPDMRGTSLSQTDVGPERVNASGVAGTPANPLPHRAEVRPMPFVRDTPAGAWRPLRRCARRSPPSPHRPWWAGRTWCRSARSP
ncbi:MAG: hypothetical protein BWY87_01151 [Deltaproteobacteria bacterium ADurb.Bin510]|nr:MAG: hypothetical protein BWY87_01151 [Deltaproteobacteria bacterium ADurb.Bin510]